MLEDSQGYINRPGKVKGVFMKNNNNEKMIKCNEKTIGIIHYQEAGSVEVLLIADVTTIFVRYFPLAKKWAIYKDMAQIVTEEPTLLTIDEVLDKLGGLFTDDEKETIRKDFDHVEDVIKFRFNYGKKLTMTEVIKKESGFPVAKLTDGENDYYLSPFRLYSFTINSSVNGNGWEVGSTRPFNFSVLNSLPDIVKMEVIRSLAATVIYEFCAGRNLTAGMKTKFDWQPDEMFRAFIKECFGFIWPNAEWPLID